MNDDLKEALADFNARMAAERQQAKKVRTAPNSYLVDLYRLYLEDNKPDWQLMQLYQVPAGYEQEDWSQLVDIQDAQMVEIFAEAGNAKITNFPTTRLADIRVQHHNKPIAVTGKVIATSDITADTTTIEYSCSNCGTVHSARNDGEPPRKCLKGCEKPEFEPILEHAKNLQVYRLQDNNLSIALRTTQESLLNVSKPGDNVYAFGLVRFRKYYDKGVVKYKKYLDIENLQSTTTNDVVLTQDDVHRIEEMAKDPLHLQILLESYAPHLIGLDEQKEVCIYTIASCGTQRPFNSLLAGPPARGKTQLLEWTVGMYPIAFKVTASGASQAGLTSITEKDPDTDTHITKPGLFALYDGGIVCITELQSIKTKEALKTSLNDALESKEVSAARADGPVRLNARCAVLFDTNNYNADWYYDSSLAHNIKFMEPNLGAFLSRLDLISIVPQVRDGEFYRNVAKSNFKTTDTFEALSKFKDDYDVDGIPRYGVETLRKYFVYVCSRPLPELSPDTEELFVNNYEKVNIDKKEFTVDGRYNRSVKTLAQVRARMLLKPVADIEDMKEAIRIVNSSKDIETSDGEGGHDANPTAGVPDKKTQRREEQFWDCYESLKAIKGEVTSKDWINELISVKGWKQTQAEQWIEKAEQAGRISGVSNNDIQRTSAF